MTDLGKKNQWTHKKQKDGITPSFLILTLIKISNTLMNDKKLE